MTDPVVRVLVLEDDTDDFLILKVMLSGIKDRRFELDRVKTYGEALSKMEKGSHDVCLLDYRLEGKNGLDFLRETHQKGYLTPIIFLTGQGDFEVDMEAMRWGASDFLYKNKIDKDMLERSIRYALERKKSAEQLRRSEEFFRAVLENAMDGVAIIEADGNIRYSSPSVKAILGYEAADKVNTNAFELIHPVDLTRVKDLFEKLLASPGLVLVDEFQVRHKDGNWHLLEASGKGHRFTNPDFHGVVLNYRDVTERKKAQITRERLANIVENTNDGVVACDLKGIVTLWNKGAEVIYGYPESEIVGKPVALLLPPGHEEENNRQIELVKNGETYHDFETVRVRKGGQLVDVSISISPFKNIDGKITGLSAIVRDITERKKSHEAMSRLASVVESSNDAIYVLTADGAVVSWNPGAQRIYGYKPEEIGGKNVAIVLPPEREEEFKGLIGKVREGEVVADFTTAHRSKDGKSILVSITLSPIRNKAGTVTRASVIVRDITERERTKVVKDMLQSERDQLLERLLLQMENMPIACVLSDENFHFTYWNPAAENLFGYSFKEVEGKTARETIIPSGENGEKVDRSHEQVKMGRGLQRGDIWEHLRKDGRRILCEWYSTPLKDSDGKLIGNMGMALDVTERQKSGEVQSQLAAILQQTTDAVVGSDLENLVFSWNRGAEVLYGYTFEEIMGKPISLLAPEDRRHESEEMREIVMAGESISNFETVRVRKNGDEVDVSVTMSPILDTRGKIVGVSAITRDISERKKAEESLKKHEEQMRRSQKMDAIGRLAGGVAHDFNNLLSVIGGNAEFLLGSMAGDNPHREEVEEIQKAVRRGAELTKQLLVFGQKQVVQPQPVNLNELSTEMSKMLKRLIDATVGLSIIQDTGIQPILADPGQMQQVILNLVLNARDAMPKGGNIIVETRHISEALLAQEQRPTLPPGTYVRLSVTDTGTGMTAEIQKHIFEPFFTTKAGKGTGLGLATVYGIVTKWSGHLFLHSALNMGTTFTFYFPALPAMEAVKAKPKQMALIPQGSETILVAEDEDPVRKILVRTLEKYGYRVLEAPNGIEAVQMAWSFPDPIHLLLTDTIMPKMNGKELADEIRKTRPQTKVVFISGYPREVLSQQGILETGIHLIQKPFELDDLVRQVRKFLDEK